MIICSRILGEATLLPTKAEATRGGQMIIGATADLHYGISPEVTQRVERFIREELAGRRLDLLVIAGDLAENQGLTGPNIGANHRKLLQLLRESVSCPIAFCAGNHDVWSRDASVDSKRVYDSVLPSVAAETGTVYLDASNLVSEDLAVVGCYGHFDYSLRTEGLEFYGMPVLQEHYEAQTPPGYREPVWMDRLMMSWGMPDREVCKFVCDSAAQRMKEALEERKSILFVSHTVPREEVNGHRSSSSAVSRFLNAFSGTVRLEEIVRLAVSQGAQVLSVSGHTHKAVPLTVIEGAKYLNVGGTYGKPRLVQIAFP